MEAITVRRQRLDGSISIIGVRKLARIELRCDSIEAPGMNGFELCAVDEPLFSSDLQSICA